MEQKQRKNRKRALLAVLFGAVIFAMAFGAAASLGGVSAANLGADDGVVASCDTNGVTISYTNSYSAAGTAGYKINSVVVGGINDACDGQDISVTLTGTAGVSLQEVSSTVPTAAGAFTATLAFGGTTLAESVTGVSVVIAAP